MADPDDRGRRRPQGPIPRGLGRIADYARSFTGFERDARLFLLTTFVAGGAISLYWIDFYLYLQALGIPNQVIGLVGTLGNLSSALVTFPASALSDRLGRRAILAVGTVLMLIATLGVLATSAGIVLALLAGVFAAGQQMLFVVQSPFLAEHSRPEHRSELFSAQFAISNVTNVIAAVGGGALATAIAIALGMDPNGAGTYRVVIAFMAVLLVGGLATLVLLTDDRPARRRLASPRARGEPAAFPMPARPVTRASRLGLVVVDRARFARLVLPGFLIALGAGQVIPYLNLFVRTKFALDLAQLNTVFAVTSLGTVLAILLQPALARRLGKVASVAIMQGASIPFLAVLGFSPVLWTVVVAMTVRNSLMNAGNPIANAFAMEHVDPTERATLAAVQSLLWSLGWVIAGPYYAILQASLGFTNGYAVGFVTIIVLYSLGTGLYWWWFRDAEGRRSRRAERALAT
ncbi:MAG TPA: MFS transporter [Candidatus Dormibacteraeota bacterium]|nr:MFS transporter [Candidatus Dormibacteraeota bacterium]